MSSASKRRQSSSDDEGGGASWMDTYGDLVTLLLCFFVLLFSFSSMDSSKWEALVGAMSGSNAIAIQILTPDMAMERPVPLIQTTDDGETPEKPEQKEDVQIDIENFMQLYSNIEEYIEANDVGAELHADFEAYVLIVRFTDNILFESGRAALLPESRPTMDLLVQALAQNQHLIAMIRIEGHTDNRPIHTSQFADNWELSMARSVNALRHILDSGRIEVTKISAVGYGEFHPVLPNDSVEGRAANRRVDFVIESIRSN